jgi:hypothetical protein
MKGAARAAKRFKNARPVWRLRSSLRKGRKAMNENATRLRETMRAARMSRRETAAALHVSIHTITAWLLPKPRANLNPCPAWAPELLALKAAARARNARAGSRIAASLDVGFQKVVHSV